MAQNQVFLSGHLNRSLSSQVLRMLELKNVYVHAYLHAHIQCAVILGCWSLSHVLQFPYEDQWSDEDV